jgi:hypothetical protein
MKKTQKGMIVTTKKRKEAYYSNYGGNERCFFEVGDEGVINIINVPKVRCKKGELKTFNCIDFIKYNKLWRVSLDNKEIEIIKTCVTEKELINFININPKFSKNNLL